MKGNPFPCQSLLIIITRVKPGWLGQSNAQNNNKTKQKRKRKKKNDHGQWTNNVFLRKKNKLDKELIMHGITYSLSLSSSTWTSQYRSGETVCVSVCHRDTPFSPSLGWAWKGWKLGRCFFHSCLSGLWKFLHFHSLGSSALVSLCTVAVLHFCCVRLNCVL